MALQWPGTIKTSVTVQTIAFTPQDFLFQSAWAECGMSFGHSCLAWFFPEIKTIWVDQDKARPCHQCLKKF